MNKKLIIGLIIVIIMLFVMMPKKERLSKNFVLMEFTKNNHGILNKPPTNVVNNIKSLVKKVLQPLRNYFNEPITITSGYRSPELNARVGGVKASEHLTGNAADIKMKNKTNKQILAAIKLLKLPVNQVIDEVLYKDGTARSWIHVSHERKGLNKGQLLTARNTKNDPTVKYNEIGYV